MAGELSLGAFTVTGSRSPAVRQPGSHRLATGTAITVDN